MRGVGGADPHRFRDVGAHDNASSRYARPSITPRPQAEAFAFRQRGVAALHAHRKYCSPAPRWSFSTWLTATAPRSFLGRSDRDVLLDAPDAAVSAPPSASAASTHHRQRAARRKTAAPIRPRSNVVCEFANFRPSVIVSPASTRISRSGRLICRRDFGWVTRKLWTSPIVQGRRPDRAVLRAAMTAGPENRRWTTSPLDGP